jgi:hypothetical protein
MMQKYGIIYSLGSRGNPYFTILEDGKTSQVLEPEAFGEFVEKVFNQNEEDFEQTETYHQEIITAQGARLNELETLRDTYLIQKMTSENSALSISERLVAHQEMRKIADQMLDAILAWEKDKTA